MKLRCKILSVSGVPASDGSIVPREVVESFIASNVCQEALRKHKLLGTLTHRSRTIASIFPDKAAALSKCIAKDDSLLIVSDEAPAPTHYISDLSVENDGWLWGELTILNEEGLDEVAVQNIRRLKGLVTNGVLPGVSAVILGYWDNRNGADYLRKIQSLKGVDITMGPSWTEAGIEEVIDDGSESVRKIRDKRFSETAQDEGVMMVKTFSNLSELGIDAPKSSKINGVFTNLKVKAFSFDEVSCNEVSEQSTQAEKEFSVVSVKERLREARLSPRMYFRKTYISYRQVVRQLGTKLDDDTMSILKALFTSDVLYVLQKITPEVINGKPLNTLLGAGALGKDVRQATQKLQIPYRMAMAEAKKQGFVSTVRYQKLQAAYMEFINALLNDVFTNKEPIPDEKDLEKADNEEKEGE